MDVKWWQKLTLSLARWAQKYLNKYTELFRNIANYEIMHVDSSQIGDIRKTVKLPKMVLHSLFILLTAFVNLHWISFYCICDVSIMLLLLYFVSFISYITWTWAVVCWSVRKNNRYESKRSFLRLVFIRSDIENWPLIIFKKSTFTFDTITMTTR
jgi:hypothetical protein